MTEFKAGDKVYNLSDTYSANICTLVENPRSKRYPLGIVDLPDTFTTDGKFATKSAIQSLALATQENYEMLCKLFPDTPWEKPQKHPKPIEILIRMFNDGWVGVPCWVSEDDMTPKRNCRNEVILEIKDTRKYSYPFKADITAWRYATPYDPKTGKPIVDYIDGNVVLGD